MELFDRLIKETISSGVEPLSLNFTGIYDCYSASPVAYRTETELFSSVTGKITDFIEKIDQTETGAAFCFHNLKKAISFVKKMTAAGRKPDWISVVGTTAFLTQDDLYSALNDFFKAEDFTDVGKICIELPKNILFADREKVKKGIADLKISGVKTVMSGVAADGFPVTALLEIKIDHAILAKEITALALDRNKPEVLSSLVRFLKSMDVSAIADGVDNDDALRELNRYECYGFIPATNYSGKFDLNTGKRDFYSALADKENE